MDSPPETQSPDDRTGAPRVADPDVAPARRGLRASLSDLAGWQKLSLGLAIFLMVAGLCFAAMGSEGPPAAIDQQQATAGQTPDGVLPSKLVPDRPGATGTSAGGAEAENGAPPWSEAIFRYGFSFFIGFAMGYALRTFLKVTLIFCGAVALAIFMLEYGGFVSVEWQALDEAFSGFLSRVGQQSEQFRTFITGSLPNAGLAAFGLVAGFKKKR